MMRTFPFTDRDIEWYEVVRSILFNLLERSGQMTFELEQEMSRLNDQHRILSSGEELYLIKRLSTDGLFISEATTHKDRDPLANLDGVHIAI
jgi:urease accessory protein UreE